MEEVRGSNPLSSTHSNTWSACTSRSACGARGWLGSRSVHPCPYSSRNRAPIATGEHWPDYPATDEPGHSGVGVSEPGPFCSHRGRRRPNRPCSSRASTASPTVEPLRAPRVSVGWARPYQRFSWSSSSGAEATVLVRRERLGHGWGEHDLGGVVVRQSWGACGDDRGAFPGPIVLEERQFLRHPALPEGGGSLQV